MEHRSAQMHPAMPSLEIMEVPPAAQQAGTRACGTVSDMLTGMHAGTLKLLDVNMFGWPAHTGRPAVGTSAECCYACADTPGCNVWNFCPLPQGCGAGCTAAKFGPNASATYVSHSQA